MSDQKSAGSKPITLSHVAREAGVSRATVSLVLRDSPLVATETRQRVRDAVEAVGYIYNRGAANLRASKTKTVGLLVPLISNPFFAELTIGVDAKLDAAGYVSFLANTGESIERQARFLRRMREQSVDGIVICPVAGSTRDVLNQLDAWHMPYVQALRYVSARDGDYVGADYELGVEQVTEHLIRLGHRRIALVGGDRAHSATFSRRKGFMTAMRRHDLPADLVLNVPPTRTAGMEAASTLLKMENPPTGAVCFNDVVALGLMVGLEYLNVRPGRDFAVTGIDDVEEAAVSFPALTTVSTSPRAVGELAADLLLRRIVTPALATERIILPTKLIVRGSSGVGRDVD